MNTIIELSDTHVIHKSRTGGLFTPDRVHALTGADLAVAARETVEVVATPTHPAGKPRTTETVT